MNQRQLGIASIAVVACIAIAAMVWYALLPSHRLHTASQSPTIGKAQVGQPAPQFSVSTTDGLFDLAKTDKPVFLEVFATWCPHCQRETAVIDKLYQKYKSRMDFLGVSGSDTGVDGTSPASQLDVLNWSQRFSAQYPVAYDASLAVANLYLQGGFPTLVVIGQDKKVAYINSGEISYNDLSTAIEKTLRSGSR
ncbi:MAG TPA: TlpA disulfide reductase family protein [Candidatus Tumulicola sp.]|jgi:thiol-disulfide isomerase/thioredoxin